MSASGGFVSSAAPVRVRPTFAIDAFVPQPDVEHVQSVRVAAPADVAFRVALAVTPDDVPGWRTLFWIRTIPARLSAVGEGSQETARPVLTPEGPAATVLFERAPRERLLGVVGRFWEPAGGLRPMASAKEFLLFQEPDHAKAAIALEVEALGPAACRVTTRTRVAATSRKARRAFRLYWTLIRPGAAMLRWSFLATVRGIAEAEVRAQDCGSEAQRAG